MNKAARKVLKTKKQFILENLILSDDILDRLEDSQILTECMIQSIKAERTDNDKIVRLLFILTRRGPNAFEEFVEAIRRHFGFLSKKLEEEYALELEASNSATADSSQETISPSISGGNLEEQDMPTTNLLCRNCSQQIKPNTEISPREDSVSGNSDFMRRMTQESLSCLYTKLKSHMTNRNLRELSFKSPQPVTVNMVDQLLDELIRTVDGCYRVLGVRDHLVTKIIHLKESKRKKKKELTEEKDVRNKFANNIMKLENKCRDLQVVNDTANRQNQKLHAEIENLKEETQEKLKEKNSETKRITEQFETTMEQLRTAKQRLQEVDDEKKQLEEKIIRYEKKTGIYNWQLQGGKYEIKRSVSKSNSFNERKNAQTHTNTWKNKHTSYAESTALAPAMPNQVKKVQHIQSQETTNFIAVEEPEDSELRQTETVLKQCYTTSPTPNKNTERVPSASSDKENNAASIGDQIPQDMDNNLDKKEQLPLSIGSTSRALNDTVRGTQARRTRFKRTSSIVRPRDNNPSAQLQQNLGVTGTNGHNVNRGVRQTTNSTPRVLDGLMIVCNNNNNSQTMQRESPRGPKAMKKHH